MKAIYLAVIEASDAEDGYSVFFPDLPGCTSWGATVDEAAENALTAAQAHVALLTEGGDDVPAARPQSEISLDADIQVEARVLVPVEIEDDRVRVNITLSRSVLALLDARAKVHGLDRSSMIAVLATAK